MAAKKNTKTTEKNTKSIKSAVAASLNGNKSFDLSDYKKSRNLNQTDFKKPEFIPMSPAFCDAISLPGLPKGHVIVLRGHSDTGKTTALIEAAIGALKDKKSLPVFIVTEMKWEWEHLKTMGFPLTQKVNEETGEVYYDGDFLYVDMDSLSSIEDVAAFIADRLDDQEKGLLPYDLTFLWDAAGTIPSQQSITSKKNNNEWNAGAMSVQFGNFIDQRIIKSRKSSSQYTNTLIVVNKVWVQKPLTKNPREMPKLKNKGGNTLYSDATLVITFGGVVGSGTSKISATKGNKKVEFAKRTKISVDKIHALLGITTTGNIIATPHGFIKEEEIEKYKKAHSDEWKDILGSQDFDIIEEEVEDSTIDVREIFNNLDEDSE